MLARAGVLLSAVALAFAASALAQETPAIPDSLVTVPALTPVIIRLDEEISTARHRSGDRFSILVAEDVRVGEIVVIPAGSKGEGEVIHAAKPGAGGKAGELILAARFVRVGDNEIRLRSFALGAIGKDRSGAALGTAFVAGPFAMFVRGGAVVVLRDTHGTAKTALEFKLPAVTSTPPEISSSTTEWEENDEAH
jgi:hypothetical protein